jgi:hypothetical protein
MMKVIDHLQIPYAKKEIAFERWRKSGYRDLIAHAEYMYWFGVCQGLK